MKRFFNLLKYLGPYKWYVIQNVIYNILGAFFALFSFAMVLPFLRVLFGNQPMVEETIPFTASTDYLMHMLNYYMSRIMISRGDVGALVLVSMLVVGFSFLKNSFLYLANYVLAPIRANVVKDIRNDVYRKVIRLPLSYYTEARKGDVMTRVSSDVQEIEISIISSLQMLFRDPITIMVYLVFLFSISYKLTLFALIIFPLTGILIGRMAKSLRRNTFKGQQKLGEVMSILEETLSGLRIIKAFNGEQRMEENFVRSNRSFARIFKRVFRRRYLASPMSEFLATIAMMFIMVYGGSLVLSGSDRLDGENLIFFLIIFSQIIVPARSLTTAWFNVQKGMASVDRIDQLLDADVRIEEKRKAKVLNNFSDSIEYRNVSFKYDTEWVLRDVSFKIKKGETIALVGKSGSG